MMKSLKLMPKDIFKISLKSLALALILSSCIKENIASIKKCENCSESYAEYNCDSGEIRFLEDSNLNENWSGIIALEWYSKKGYITTRISSGSEEFNARLSHKILNHLGTKACKDI